MFHERLSDLGDRSEHGGRARSNLSDFEAHSGPTQRKIGACMDAGIRATHGVNG